MSLSDLAAHVYMVNHGWDTRALDAISEAEFLSILATQTELDEARAEARTKVMEE